MAKRKKTHQQFILEIKEKFDNEYTILGEYAHSQTKILTKHNKCGYKWEVLPSNLLNGNSKCPNCSGKIRYSTESFSNIVDKITDDEYSVLGKYVNNNTKIQMKHMSCDNIYTVRPADFLRGRRCPKCSKEEQNRKQTKTQSQFIKEVFDIVGNEYIVLSEYKSTHTKLNIKHNICNYIWNVAPSSFLSGSRCPNCAGRKRKTTESFKQEIYDLFKNEYVVLEEYSNCDTYIRFRHNLCNTEFDTTPYCFLNLGRMCPKCNKGMRKTSEIFKSIIFDLEGGDYELQSEYINDATHVVMKHNVCNHIYEVTPSNFLRGKRCPKCKSSKGEVTIIKWLELNNIKHKLQYKFDDCRNLRPLPFDIAITDQNDNLKFLIEYDGQQHFEPVDIFGGQEAFEDLQLRDRIKNEFCKKNSIPLLRIPYWEFNNIEKILNTWFSI
jgi:predicted nucleic-acid-binding Zn-ribbon protein